MKLYKCFYTNMFFPVHNFNGWEHWALHASNTRIKNYLHWICRTFIKKGIQNYHGFFKDIGLTVAFTISDNINETFWYCPAFYYADLDSCKWTPMLFPSLRCNFTECDESCEDTCTGDGPKGCDDCAEGYVWDDTKGCLGMQGFYISNLPTTYFWCFPLRWALGFVCIFHCEVLLPDESSLWVLTNILS